MFAAQIGYSIGLLYALYLFSISYFVIQALCPWCLLVTLTTIMVWFAITRFNIRERNLYLSKPLDRAMQTVINKDYDKLAMFSLIMFLVLAILLKYGNGLFV